MLVSLSHKKDIGQLICFLKVFTYHFMISFRVIHDTKTYGRQHETKPIQIVSAYKSLNSLFAVERDEWVIYTQHSTLQKLIEQIIFFVSAMLVGDKNAIISKGMTVVQLYRLKQQAVRQIMCRATEMGNTLTKIQRGKFIQSSIQHVIFYYIKVIYRLS